MKRTVIMLILWLVGLVAPTAAQQAPEMKSLNVALWPEFDRPDVLVIYQGAFAEDAALPVATEFRIPARVGRPTAVAYITANGERLNQVYTTRTEGDDLVVSFELTGSMFQLEYYDALPPGAGGEREYFFAYTADYTIGDLTLEFQVPPTAEDLVVEPNAGATEPGADGLLYYRVDGGPVERGETRSWSFAYVKDNDDLTAAAEQAPQVQASPAAPAAQSQDGGAVWIFLVAFVALLAVGGGAFWLGRSTRPPADEGGVVQRRAQPGSDTDARFCYKCGAGLRYDSDFCHKCGAAARR